jgi:U3 small nucleolar RNA-associated protein 10
LKLVMKLNDTTFRPFFITLRDWAFHASVGEVKLRREIFFYNLLNQFLATLQVLLCLSLLTKTVVTTYYGIVLDDTVKLLEGFKDGSVHSKELWTSVINSLNKSFTYDLDQDGKFD